MKEIHINVQIINSDTFYNVFTKMKMFYFGIARFILNGILLLSGKFEWYDAFCFNHFYFLSTLEITSTCWVSVLLNSLLGQQKYESYFPVYRYCLTVFRFRTLS